MKDDNIIKKLINKVTAEQVYKCLRVVIICMIFMVFSEGLFEIPAVAQFFGQDLILGKSGWLVYLIIWLVMFAQVAIIPIPALPILVACNQIPNLIGSSFTLSGLFSFQTLLFILLVTSATVLGAITSYWIGRCLGKPAIKWVAGSEEDYEKWSNKLNGKIGKWVYAGTVLLPIFPDDLISLVVGSIKMNFSFYAITNLICKFIGLYSMLILMRLPGVDIFFGREGNGFPVALVVYSLILISAFIMQILIKKVINKRQAKDIKVSVIKEKILYIINKKKSAYKDLIIDYKLEKTFKTYLSSKIHLHKIYTVNKDNKKQKIKIIIEYKASDYWQVCFNKTYKLTATYEELQKDIEACDFY